MGIYGGVKDGIKTIVPATATLKMVARLVPNQNPAKVLNVSSLPLCQSTGAPAAKYMRFLVAFQQSACAFDEIPAMPCKDNKHRGWCQRPETLYKLYYARLQAIEAHVKAHTHELANLTFTRMPFAADPYFTSRDTAPNVAAAKVHFSLPSDPAVAAGTIVKTENVWSVTLVFVVTLTLRFQHRAMPGGWGWRIAAHCRENFM